MANVSLSVRVRIDVKAALVAGKMLGEYEMVEVSQEIMGEFWGAFATDLRKQGGEWVWNNKALCDADASFILKWYIDNHANQVAAVEVFEGLVKERDITLSEPMVDADCYWTHDREDHWEFGKTSPEYRNFTGKKRVLPSDYFSGTTPLPSDLQTRLDTAIRRFEEQSKQNYDEVSQANNEILSALLPQLKAAKADHEAAEAKRIAEANAAREARKKARWEARLKTGYWYKETPSYNERRHGAYWCASVSFEGGPKPIYTWGESTGKWGQSGILRVPCKPGDIIAWGQKDQRRPDKSDHFLLLMQDNGSMIEIDKTEAWKHWQEQHAVKA